MTHIPNPIVLYTQQRDGVTGDCDCACALELSPPSASLAPARLWQKRIDLLPISHPNINGEKWRAFFNPQGPAALVVMNQDAISLLDEFSTPSAIRDVDSAIWDMVSAGVLAPLEAETPLAVPMRVFSAWLHLTDACNLRCDYCYLPHLPKPMSFEVAQQAVQKIFEVAKQAGYQKVKLKYAGGEPLLNFEMFLQIHELAQQIAQQTKIPLEEVLLTNGTLLTREKVTQIKNSGARVMISMDGIGEVHDRHRKFAGGQPTFALVERGLNECLAQGITPLVSITISGRTLSGLSETVDYLLGRNIPFSFNFYRENDCSQTQQSLNFDSQAVIEALAKALAVIRNYQPQASLLGALGDRASLTVPHQHTCGAGRDYMVVHPDGGLSKCQMEFIHPVAHISSPRAFEELVNSKLGVQNLPVHQKQTCRDCQWANWCAGGCPLVTYRATGRYDAQSPNCEIYQFLLPAILELETERLIRQFVQ